MTLPQTVKGPSRKFERPTLGYPARLGELFDEHTGCFLGVQLCAEESSKVGLTNFQRTCLTLSSSKSLEEKASLLNIEPGLSLAILGGLVKLDESASSYLNDIRSNSLSRSWTLALHIETEERRLLFTPKATNVAAMENISQKHATHFVSSITYGGNLIVGMTEKAMDVVYKENTEKELGSEIERLRGAVSLNTKVDAKVKAQFEGMNSRVDLVVHSDINLQSVPLNPADVLDTIPEVAKLLLGDPGNGSPKGVPISVTLQPIPKSILDDTKAVVSVYQIRLPLALATLGVFAQLEDIRKRYHVLSNRLVSYNDYMPKFSKHVHQLSSTYSEFYATVAKNLGRFLSDLMTKGESDVKIFSPYLLGNEDVLRMELLESAVLVENWEGGFSVEIRDQSMLDHARSLFEKQAVALPHVTSVQLMGDDGVPFPFEEHLVALERTLSKFQHLVRAICRVPVGLVVDEKISSSPFSTVEEVSKACYNVPKIHLFLMVSLEKCGFDMRFLHLLRKFKRGNSRSRYILYVEDFSELVANLPGGEVFSDLGSPSYYVGKLKKGKVSWKLKVATPDTPA
ncbi:hypothetical protein EDD16DRAFT_1895716 [Pisolithus croceorrhizus]|nr:hypothetical protein EV401DRAFT_1982623 [Pisolithus croceorrhizus]KAI6119042.1 hypothetical protein EDD16DRAFT_1895716 [Pisolithus croceorrhizus]KAI6163380.1 hypothetical protein EDD17DRAFT_1569831 [Pisolithus thermaeus]